MPQTDTSTRQRLLDLWEKCPECKPELLRCNSLGFWFLNVAEIGELHAFDLACIAMVRWLAELNVNLPSKVEIWHGEAGWTVITDQLTISRATLTDALISAVEAVMDADKEKQDATSLD